MQPRKAFFCYIFGVVFFDQCKIKKKYQNCSSECRDISFELLAITRWCTSSTSQILYSTGYFQGREVIEVCIVPLLT